MNTIVIVGSAQGQYHNEDISKEFSGKILAIVRPNNSLIIQSLSGGIRPICYIGEGAKISVSKLTGITELLASTEDGQLLRLTFEEVSSICGVSENDNQDSIALTILKCVNDLTEKYGRVRVARLLRGSTSKSALNMSLQELQYHGTAKETSQKEILVLIDWLIDEGYLGFPADKHYPTFTITDKGIAAITEPVVL